jgi:hypothetical protein
MSAPALDRDEVERRLALVLGRYGDRLDSGQAQGLCQPWRPSSSR